MSDQEAPDESLHELESPPLDPMTVILQRLEEVQRAAEEAKTTVGVLEGVLNKQRRATLTNRVLMVLLLALGGWVWHISSEADSNQRAAVIQCNSSNDSREGNSYLWNSFLAAIPPANARTAEYDAAILKFVDQLYALHNCNDLNAKPPPLPKLHLPTFPTTTQG